MDRDLLGTLERCAAEIRTGLGDLADWGLAGTRPGQYRSDLVADSIGVKFLLSEGFGVLSEESGAHEPDRELLAVMDPVDGSTNASRGIPWFATSICVLDRSGPLAAFVVNQATGTAYRAMRGQGAFRGERAIHPRAVHELRRAMIGVSGYPNAHLGWKQFRALGAIALDLCAVAEGALDGFVDCVNGSRPWDYLAGMLICLEAGARVDECSGAELVCRDYRDRRSPVAAATDELLSELLGAYRESVDLGKRKDR